MTRVVIEKDIEIAFKPPKDENGDWILPSKGLASHALEFFTNQTKWYLYLQ